MNRIRLDRRGFLATAATGALAPWIGGAWPASPSPATVDILRVCNTDYYPAAGRLFGLAPGRALEILFDHDPTFIEQASAGLWLNGEKVGDAPASLAGVAGTNAGGRAAPTARVEAIRPATEYDGPACLARVELTPAPAALPAVFLGEGRIHRHAGRVLSAGDVLRLAAGSPELERRAASPWAAPVGLETLAGEPAGRLFADQRGVAGRMAGSGLRVAVVVATTASTDGWARATIHLLD